MEIANRVQEHSVHCNTTPNRGHYWPVLDQVLSEAIAMTI